MGASGPAVESVRPLANQQIEPALEPQSTVPPSHASRRTASNPCSRHTASMLRVFPPPTCTTSKLAR